MAEEEVTGYVEEVHKLVAALLGTATGRRRPSSGLCSPYIWHPRASPVHRYILYGSENRLWDLVANAMGEETYAAALGAYGLAAEEVSPLLDGRQGMVVELARRLAQSASL